MTGFVHQDELNHGYFLVFRGNKSARPIFEKAYARHSVFIKNQLSAIVEKNVMLEQDRQRRFRETHDHDTRLPNESILLEDLKKEQAENPQGHFQFLTIHFLRGSEDHKNGRIKKRRADSIRKACYEKHPEIGNAGIRWLYQHDSRTFTVRIPNMQGRKSAIFDMEKLMNTLNSAIEKDRHVFCQVTDTDPNNIPALIDRAISVCVSEGCPFYEASHEDLEEINIEESVAKMLLQLSKPE